MNKYLRAFLTSAVLTLIVYAFSWLIIMVGYLLSHYTIFFITLLFVLFFIISLDY